MLKPYSPLMSVTRKSCSQALNAFAIIGVSSMLLVQAAFAMGEVNKSSAGEVLVENTEGGLHCEIVTHSVSQSLEMSAVVWSNNTTTGSYSFIVTKQGASGRSNVAQSGLFEVEPSERKTIGSVMVNASQGDSYLARLLVRSGMDEVICDTKIE